MWTILQHAAWEGPGLIADGLREHDIGFRVLRLDEGAIVPDSPAAFDGLVVMGGPMGVYEAERHPFLAAELKLLAACVAADKPVLGVCLGAQLLAAALGAPVARGPALEAGVGEVALTLAGREDPVLGGAGDRLPVVHWHQDTFPLPPDATRLASSSLYEQQAFRLGRCIYGLQFHLEVDTALAAAWREQGQALDPESLAPVAAAGKAVIGRFLDLAL